MKADLSPENQMVALRGDQVLQLRQGIRTCRQTLRDMDVILDILEDHLSTHIQHPTLGRLQK